MELSTPCGKPFTKAASNNPSFAFVYFFRYLHATVGKVFKESSFAELVVDRSATKLRQITCILPPETIYISHGFRIDVA